MYRRRIAELEGVYRTIQEKIQRESTPALLEERKKIIDELAVLRRRQYEYEHEYLENNDDDR